MSPAENFTARLVLYYWERDCLDVDGSDLQDMMVAAGLAEERPATQEEINTNEAMQEFGTEPGDPWYFPTPEMASLMDEYRETELLAENFEEGDRK